MSLFKNDGKQFKAEMLRKRELLATLGVSRSKPPADKRLRMPSIKGAVRDRPRISSLEPNKEGYLMSSKVGLETQVRLNRVRLTPVSTNSPEYTRTNKADRLSRTRQQLRRTSTSSRQALVESTRKCSICNGSVWLSKTLRQ